MITPLTNWSGWLIFLPSWYIDTDAVEGLDIEAWSERYEWEQDPWGGALDYVSPVAETVATEAGDCEDYALVVLSVLARDGTPGELGYCFDGYRPRHVIAYGNGCVFSSGEIALTDPATWLRDSRYTRLIRRPVPAKLTS